MPPRWLTFGIIVLWIGMTGWLFVREYWPQWQPGQPPPIHIELADEAQNNIPIRWTIIKDDEDRGYARTAINFRENKNPKQVRTAEIGIRQRRTGEVDPGEKCEREIRAAE